MKRIEIFLTTAMEVSHWAPIVRALMELEQDVSFISPQTTPQSTTMGWDDADRTELLLKQLDLPWTKRPDFSADCVLTIQPEDFVSEYKHIKMRMTYGVGLVPPAVITNSGRPFDYHLVHGPFNQRVQFRYHALASPMLPADRVKVIGYPRFDKWFQVGAEWRWDSWEPDYGDKKPILLWLPTWGRASSIDRYADAIFALSDKYDIWVKPHHGTVHWERERMARLEAGPCRVVDFTDPPEPSFAAASVVLADHASGAFAEALFLKKKLVGLSHWESPSLVPMASLIPICPDVGFLANHARIASEMNYGIYQEMLRRDLVDSTEGADGMRAARTIVEALAG